MELANLAKINGNKGPKKRVGRGGGSGKGFHTTGKGNKGQKARSGHGAPLGFEGGQVPLYKKLPAIRGKGFKRAYKIKSVPVNLGSLNDFAEGDVVTPQLLLARGFVNKDALKRGVKILGHGDIEKKLKFEGVIFSKSVQQKIQKAGSTILTHA